jgi:hypothetical protein
MNKTWLTAGMSAAAAILALAASAPERTHDVLSAPARWADSQEQEQARQASRAYWDHIRLRADEGDPDAMYQLGTSMTIATNAERSGVEKDAAEGERWIRTAAAEGHLGARLTVWTMDGSRADELVDIAELALQRETDARLLYGLPELLRWIAVRDCHAGARDAAGRVNEVVTLSMDVPDLAGAAVVHQAFERSFDETCAMARERS